MILFFVAISSCKKPKELLKKDWVAYSYKMNKDSDKEFPEKGKKYTLYFDGEGSFKFKLDFNALRGNVDFISNNKIKFNGGYMTQICCDSVFSMNVAFSLVDIREYKIEENILYLTNDKGLEIKFVQ
jgi:hypothetical protein